jgi:hypothetical protein
VKKFLVMLVACSSAQSASNAHDTVSTPHASIALSAHNVHHTAAAQLARRGDSSAPRSRDENPTRRGDALETSPVAAATRARSVGDERVTARVTAVHLVASVDGKAASDRPAYARADQTVTLYAVVRAGDTYYSDAPAPSLGQRPIAVQPLARGPRVALAWSRIEPTQKTMSNTASGKFRFEQIEYANTAVGAGDSALVADVRPTLTPDHGDGVGTMRYQLTVTQGDRSLATPGLEARRGRGSGGLTDAVMRVTIRRDDSYLGFLTEMYGQPYVWASAGLSDTTHQSERLEGSDCADLMVYGARRLGKRVPYTWTGGLPKITALVAAGSHGADGIYRDKTGRPLPYTRDGDLVLFPRHVGALAEDRGTKGVLDDQDIMIHTLFDSPKAQKIADSGYAHHDVEVRRFR